VNSGAYTKQNMKISTKSARLKLTIHWLLTVMSFMDSKSLACPYCYESMVSWWVVTLTQTIVASTKAFLNIQARPMIKVYDIPWSS